MSVWLTIPSKKRAAEAEQILGMWRNRGYRLAIWRDDGDEPVSCDLMKQGRYPGYARACVQLIHAVIEREQDAEWFICAGDDIEPDQNHQAEEIAAQCRNYFNGTFGVMQPTGDRWGDGLTGAYIDRVAGSAWFGRDYCLSTYGGWGPLYEGYHHMFVDEEAQRVAEAHGCFWQRPDLIHLHRHWARQANGGLNASKAMPSYLKHVNSPEHWAEASRLFQARVAAGFPGAMAI